MELSTEDMMEYRADYFARCLLMDEQTFCDVWNKLPYKEFGTKVAEIAKIFQVPIEQAYIRVQELIGRDEN